LDIHPYKITVVPKTCGFWNKNVVLVTGFSVMCMMDISILSWHFSQMRVILISWDMVTHKTTGIGAVKSSYPKSTSPL
jgi:hypothetical protein